MNKIIFYIVIGFVVFASCFYIAFCDSHATDIPGFELSSSAQSSINSFTSPEFTFGNSGDLFVVGVDRALQEINYQLYNKYGYDLEDLSIDMWDDLTNPSLQTDRILSKITDGQITSTSAAAAAGWKVYGYPIIGTYVNGLNNAKNYVLGKWDEVTGKVTQIYDNCVTYIDDNFFNTYSQVFDDVQESNNPILDFSLSTDVLYGKNFQFSSNFDYIVNIKSTEDVYFYTTNSINYHSYC